MRIIELKALLKENHKAFTEFFNGVSKEEFEKNKHDKWSLGQNLEHIYLSIKPLAGLKAAPKFFIKTSYGKAKKGSRSYQETVDFYKSFLDNGGKASDKYVPSPVTFDRKEELIKKIDYTLSEILASMDKFTEKDFDELQLPHPLMGKLTMREMFYFTAYHVTHHHEIVKRDR